MSDRMVIDEEDYLAHYGILRKSGRYPWGSGENPAQRSKTFFDHIEAMKKQGLSEAEIADGLGMKITELRDVRTIANNAKKQHDIGTAVKLKETGMSNTEIGKEMGRNESSVRALLEPSAKAKADILMATSNMLKEHVDKNGFTDVGAGVESQLGISKDKLRTAVAILKDQGYVVHPIQTDQLGTFDNKTRMPVLCPPGTKYKDVAANKDKITTPLVHTEDGGHTYDAPQPPMHINSKRVGVVYAEDGGAHADGVIYVRPGVKDVYLGGANYAQVRIAVDGTHYLKGMAMYKDDLPAGVDLMFNTNKKRADSPNKLSVMKELNKTKDGSVDQENPFGSNISRQITKLMPDGSKKLTSVMNIVNEEGRWAEWSNSISSQFLSKQSPKLAAAQLGKKYDSKKKDLDEIMALTNPAVRRKLLESYADSADSSSVDLKAAAFPKQGTHVILPVPTMKPTEVYAPNYTNGDRVILVRFPHGGTFEIPELTVNNNHAEAKRMIGKNAPDAIGIHHKVAERLSGADFDGDTVLVIPNHSGAIKSTHPLAELKNFDPREQYKAYEGMPKMKPKTKQQQMGDVSNLITDMTIKGAPPSEIARAVKHSMVVIDAEKHHLDYKKSAIDQGIAQLKKKYQGRTNAGASTLVSRASSVQRVPERKKWTTRDIDPATGKKIYRYTNESYVNKKGKVIQKTTKSTKMGEADNAHSLSSGTPMESVYADHANRLKSLANAARKESVHTTNIPYSPSAKRIYSEQVNRLNSALAQANRNRPRERQAQIIAKATVDSIRQANPDMDDAELKKVTARALATARLRTGSKKPDIHISDTEWEAIQAGAISNHKLREILDNADLDRIKELATPRPKLLMTTGNKSRAKAMLDAGRTQAEVAAALGVSLTTLKNGLKEG